ncbi:cation:proton antiporter family protein [Aliamphritea hakodatensis]|uniref:cation:proton antiporter family protein n=1 Tax=Aliamphritea hakodatensis TaxID=2895352 RepID=UPI0022FDAD89|nr:cation:proton antiporter family protein [Aliamphritea hakodatensis]
MDFIWILFAFVCGLGMKLISLPPLIGYLLAGFVLHFAGVTPDDTLNTLADLGITLMLFTIGLKLDIRSLLKAEVWVGALSHMGIWIVLFFGIALGLGAVALPFFSDLTWQSAALLAFLLSFSSTVCVVKLLEESGEMKTRHGKLAIGVLVMQDLVAVLFMAVATGKEPTIWAFGLIALVFLRPLFDLLLSKSGHGELLPLAGFFMALGGYELFELVGIKGDLGALIVGALLSSSPKATELSKTLLNFKDLFLIGFFLSIGFTALPDWPMFFTALLLAVLLPLKFFLFFALFTRLKLRGRTAYLGALTLSNVSEFGLIVAALAVDTGWITEQWLVIISLMVSISFIFTSTIYKRAHEIYSQKKDLIKRYETPDRLKVDVMVQPEEAEILVIGLGRVGSGAYHALHSMAGDRVWGIDADRTRVSRMRKEGMKVCPGDGEDADFWEQLNLSRVKLVLLALPSIEDSRNIVLQLKHCHFEGKVAAIARYQDEHQQLQDAGIDKVFNFFTEAGFGFAEESMLLIDEPGRS